ncbi:MAG: hypothetical protein Tsb009_03690 [Planctomycetaceae bacterium]
MQKRITAATCLVLLTAAIASPNLAHACPFCSAPSLTLSEQMAQADSVVLVKWVEGKKSDGKIPGSTTYEIVEVSKGSKATLKPGKKIILTRFRPAKKGDLFLLMGSKSVNIEWGSPLEVTKASYQYISKAPNPEQPVQKRLVYFMKYLEFPDLLVSNDAYAEFANAPYKDIAAIADKMPRDRIRKWVASKETPQTRLGLYGLMLGLCGKPADAELMKKKILAKSDDFRLGIDGVMSGYLLLTGEEGLEVLDEHKLDSSSKVPFSETYAAMQALRFLWTYSPKTVEKSRLRKSMRNLLKRPELADLVIADLARWKDWSIQDQLMKLYTKKEYNIPSIKRAIVRYMLVCANDKDEKSSNGKVPQHVLDARKNLAMLEKTDPKTVRNAKRFFFIK